MLRQFVISVLIALSICSPANAQAAYTDQLIGEVRMDEDPTSFGISKETPGMAFEKFLKCGRLDGALSVIKISQDGESKEIQLAKEMGVLFLLRRFKSVIAVADTDVLKASWSSTKLQALTRDYVGSCYLRLGDFTQAKKQFAEELKLDENESSARTGLERADAKSSNNIPPKIGFTRTENLFHMILGNTGLPVVEYDGRGNETKYCIEAADLERHGDFSEALKLRTAALKASPESPHVIGRLAISKMSNGILGSETVDSDAIDEAIQLLLKAEKLDPQNWRHTSNLAACYFLKNDQTSAVTALTRLPTFNDFPKEQGEASLALLRRCGTVLSIENYYGRK